MQSIKPCLWFDDQAEDAARFYCSFFPKSKLGRISTYGEHGMKKAGTVLAVEFKLLGIEMQAINGGDMYKPTPAISFSIACKNQKEIDHYWERLTSNGGKEIMCGWVTDRYGFSWQVVPVQLAKLMSAKDKASVARVTEAMMKMVKLDLKTLEAAAKPPKVPKPPKKTPPKRVAKKPTGRLTGRLSSRVTSTKPR